MSHLSLSLPADDFDIHRIGPAIEVNPTAKREVGYFFYRIRHDSEMVEVCIANAKGPVRVESRAPDGTIQKWESRQVEDLLVFYAPDGYTMQNGGPAGIGWDNRLMDLQPLPEDQGGRVDVKQTSVNFGGS